MKKLIDFCEGELTGLIFDGTNKQILEWIECNLNKFNLNEQRSCSVTLEGSEIFITGDEDLRQIEIKKIKPIKL
tara:strand:- start:2559 stop:2780 length:222 start_codon:yes stop_codon:yes gene_type:complete